MIIVVVLGLGVGGVCVVGILAAIAIPAFRGYIMRSKTQEAPANLHLIATAEQSYCTEHGNWLFPAGPVPATVPSGVKTLPDFGSDPTFSQLGVAIGDPVYYSYSIRPSANGAGEIDLVAHGDLDGDGAQSTFTLHCGPGCSCGSEPQEDDALE